MTRTRTSVLTGTFVLLAGAIALTLVLLTGKSSGSGNQLKFGAGLTGPTSKEAKAGEGPVGGYEAYLSAARTYPAASIPPSVVARARLTFNRIARADARHALKLRKAHKLGALRRFLAVDGLWSHYGPRTDAVEPGVLAFSGATNSTASRITAMVADPDCKAYKCRVWAAAAGGGVWVTENILTPTPTWRQLSPESLEQNSTGALVLDPTDAQHRTLYLGTGEGNRCSSGCEAGVGIYKSTDAGNHWRKLSDACVSNATYTCATPGRDAFLGRGINSIVVDPTNKNHIFVGSALAVRGLSHVIGNPGETQRFEPGANEPGLYESFDGGSTFTEVWDGAKPDPLGPGGSNISFGVTDVALDPLDSSAVYASAFDAGAWRRSTLDGSTGPTDFRQIFAPQYPGGGTDRTMFALTVKGGQTRIYLTDGTANGAGITLPPAPPSPVSNFWRVDNGNQPAATLLASQAAGATEPPPDTVGPQFYAGWQKLTSRSTASPYYATVDFCTGQCWYDNEVYTPAGMPDTVYVFGSYLYGELPCNTKGVGCGNGRSDGRGVLYSTTAGDPEPVTTADGTQTTRTFTDLTYDGQNQPAPWCALDGAEFTAGGVTPPYQCLWAPDGIHPDQHALVINPGNPTQIFEGSDGGVIRTSGTFTDISSRCNSNERPLLGAASLNNCKRLLSRVPVQLDHVDKNLSSTLQFVNVAINPTIACEVMGGTQDNGTWSNNNRCSTSTWPQIIYGDGGNAVYDATNPTWRANEFTSGAGDANFDDGEPTQWVITTAPLVNSGELFAFYWPQVGDPNPVPGTHPIYNGGQHVWRSWAFGAGTPGAVPQDTTPNIADYKASCPEFTASFNKPGCGDYQPLGGPAGTNTAGDLTGTVYGGDRTGGSSAWVARDRYDHGTIWAATSAGRIFVTHNGDEVNPAAVVWHRIDNATSPTRYPSAIYPDPSDPSHAWVTYSGYNFATPTTPGHVFEVHENGSTPGSGTFTNLNVESGTSAFPTPFSDGDLPVSDIVRDDATHTLYVGTDFGVLRGDNDGASWHVTRGMPRYEIMHLAIQPSSRAPTCIHGDCQRILYAATHSQGIWRMSLNR